MKVLIIALIILSLVPGTYSTFFSPLKYFSALSTVSSGVPMRQGIEGIVSIGPIGSCGDPPPRLGELTKDYQVAVHSSEGTVTYVVIDWNDLTVPCVAIRGHYIVGLAPGDYQVHLMDFFSCGRSDLARYCDSGAFNATVKQDVFTTLNFTVYTGFL